jgi:serine/threonine protein kinase
MDQVESAPLGRYRLIALLGQGGMADVYLACTHGPGGFQKLLVVKLARFTGEPLFSTMFLDEARIAAQLSHPNIVQTYEVGETGTRHYIVMEYLDGANLARLRFRARKRGGMPLRFSVHVLVNVLEGLEYAHSARGIDGRLLRVVHRDLTPSNILVTTHGEVKIVDFGIAKAVDTQSFTATGRYSGKLHYMPPEQLRAESPDGRADIFSLGVSLAEAARNERFWGNATGPMVASRLMQGDIPTLIGVDDVDPELARICARALAPRREERYPNAAAFKTDLARFLHTLGGPVPREDLGAFVAETVADDRSRLQSVVDSQIQRLTQLALSSNPPLDLPRISTGDDDVIIERVPEPGAQTPMPLPVAMSNTPPPLRAATITVPPRTIPGAALPSIPSTTAPPLVATPVATITMLPFNTPIPRSTSAPPATGTGRSASRSGLIPKAVSPMAPDTTPIAMAADIEIDDLPVTEITPNKVASPVSLSAAAPAAPSSGSGASSGGDPPGDNKFDPRASGANLASMHLPAAPGRSRTPVYVSIGIAGTALVALVIVLVIGRSPAPATAPTSPTAAAPAAPAPAAPATAKLEVIVTPVDAQLALDGRTLGANPFVGALVRDGQVHDLVVSASGFETLSRRFIMDQDVMLQLALQPAHPTPAATSSVVAPVAPPPAAATVASHPTPRATAPRPVPVARPTPPPTPAPAAIVVPPPTQQPAIATAPPAPAQPATTTPGSSKRSLDSAGYDTGSNKRSLDTDVYDGTTKKPTIDRENPWKK